MATHEELITEMPLLEKMTIQDRLKHAKKRRNQQLKRYQQYERDFQRKTKKLNSQKSETSIKESHSPAIMFAANVQLLEAAARGDTEEVEAFLKSGVDPNTGNEDGLTALHQSCIDNREDMLKVLLDNGADVNITDRELWTPLHAASTCGHKSLAAQLISRGADLLAINSDGNMPYDICEDEETLDYIESQMAAQGITQDQIDDLREVAPNKMLADMKKLAEEGGNLEFQDEVGATPLHIAVAQGFEKVVEFLLESKVDIHARDEDGWQPIHAAACWAQSEIIQILVEHGADLESRTTNNETPLMICEEDDIKSLLHQLKTESLKNQRHSLVRRGSSRKNRGSSIRRSSKKGEMRKMDAKGEAAFIQSQEIPATNIDDVISNGTSEDAQKTEESLANGEASSQNSKPVSPDVIMIDEPLPDSKLSHLETENGKEEQKVLDPSAESQPDANGDAIIHTNQVEPKRPKSILKKTPSRVESEPEKLKKEDRKSDRKSELGRNISQEQKQKEKEEKEKERKRLKEEKEKKKQREKEEKQKRKEDQASKKQKNKEQSRKEPTQEEINNSKSQGQDEGNTEDTDKLTNENNGPVPDTLSELKRQRQQVNSPIHSNTGSPNLSASSDKSSDTQVSDKPNGESGDAKPHAVVGNNKQSSRFSAKFPFSLPFMQSYNLHDNSSNYDERKRDSIAMTDEMQDTVLPADSNNKTSSSTTVEADDGEPLKKFTAYSDSQGLPEDETTEACCKIM